MRDPGFGVRRKFLTFDSWNKITVVTAVQTVSLTVRLRSADRFRHLSDRDFTCFGQKLSHTPEHALHLRYRNYVTGLEVYLTMELRNHNPDRKARCAQARTNTGINARY